MSEKYARKMACVIAALFCIMGFSGAHADQLTIDIPPVNVTVTKDADGFAKFTGEGIQYLSQPGQPAVPYLVVKALLPPGSDLSTLNVTVEREDVESEAVSGETWNVRPVPEPVAIGGEYDLNAFGEDEAVYSTSIRFPYSIVGTVSVGSLWEWQIVDIPLALFHWNPVTKGLFTLKSSQAVLTFDHKSLYARRSAQTFSGRGRELVKNMVVNFDQVAPEYPAAPSRRSAADAESYVIVTTNAINNASLQLKNFAQHKISRGFNARIFTENIWGGGTGNTAAENIRNWLIANDEAMNIAYVLLIGNPHPVTGDVPMKMLWPRNNATVLTDDRDSPTDYYYADLTGNWDLDGDGKYGEWKDDFGPGGVDRIFELKVGRIPYYGSISELDAILAKTIAYQNESNQEWRKKVLLPMEPAFDVEPSYRLGEEIKNSILVPKNWAYHRVYDNTNQHDNNNPLPIPADTETVPCTVSNVTGAWKSSQFGAVFWLTHGSPYGAADIMDVNYAATLDNTHPVFTFQGSCTNSQPEISGNLAYTLLKNGAVATVGSTRVSWGVNEPPYAGNTTLPGLIFEYAKRLAGENMKCGDALADMKQNLIPAYMHLWMNFTNLNLYGDPELAMIETNVTDNPPAISEITDQTTQRDIEITVPFTVSDDITPAADLVLSVTSSNTALVPTANMVFGGSGEERTLKITPAAGQTGSCTVTITVKDGMNNTSTEGFIFSIGALAEWQWMNPLPMGNNMNATWGSSANDVFAVGDAGTISHYNGNNWTKMDIATSANLNGIWGNSENDVFAVGEAGTILHYNGISWTQMNSGVYSDLNGIWGSSVNDIFVVGGQNSIASVLHYDGSSWKEINISIPSLYSLYAVWGTAYNNIFAVGNNCIILHYNGNSWDQMNNGLVWGENNGDLKAIWGTSANNVFAVGAQGYILQYNGSNWTKLDSGLSGDSFYGIWGTSANNVFAVGFNTSDGGVTHHGIISHYDGLIWQKMIDQQISSCNILYAIWGTSENNIFAAGGSGTILKYNGNGNSWITNQNSVSNDTLNAIWGSSENDVFAVGGDYYGTGTILHYDGASWTKMLSYNIGGDGVFRDVWGSSDSDVFVVGAKGTILHYNGSSWTEMISGTSYDLSSLWGSSGNNVFVLGNQYDGTNWNGIILHYNGSIWTKIQDDSFNGLNGFTSVWGISGSNVFIAGGYGYSDVLHAILHYDGITWTKMTNCPVFAFGKIWGTSDKDIYLVDANAIYLKIFHYDGSNWNDWTNYIMNTNPRDIYGMWGTNSNDVFAVGYNGTIRHYDGNQWTEMITGTKNTLIDIWGSSSNNVFAVGAGGTILHYTPPTEKPVPVLSITPASQSLIAAGGTTAFTITNAGTGSLTWTAEENEPWFSISPASGSAPGTLTVTYEANTGEERTGEIVITAPGAANSPKTVTLTQARKAGPHFTKVWTGQGIDTMLFMIGKALINGVSMQPGDEIGVFDGQHCVGAIIIDGPISWKTKFLASMDDDPLDAVINGFTPGNAITFKIWDASAGVQYDNVQAYFKDSNGNDRTPFPFAAKIECPVMLEAGTQQQNLSLASGWNIMSSYVVPENTDMMAMVQPLIDSGRLIKVIDESGNRIYRFMGEWINDIGNFDPGKGYQIKVTSSSQLAVEGGSLLSHSNIWAASQSDLFLKKGWNIISYPFPQPQAAMTVLQPLIDMGALEKVIDESGNRIVRFMNEWMDYVGSFDPGKGYQIKVNADVLFSIKDPGLSGRSEDIPRAVPRTPTVHFTPIWTGNPFGSMIIYVTGIAGATVQPGDEIAVYDGENCVGASSVQSAISDQNRLRIACASDDDITDSIVSGFMPGNTISFRYWNSAQNREITDIATAYISLADGQPAAVQTFTVNGDIRAVLTIGSGTAEPTLLDAVLALKLLTGIYFNPENTNADADGDGKVQLSDVILILQKVAGIRQ